MTEASNEAQDRPRPGPIRLLLAAAGALVITFILFAVFLASGSPGSAAVLLLLLPLADGAIRISRAGRYVARHTGLAASSYTLTAVWTAGLAALVAGGEAPGPVWVAAGGGAIAAGAAAVERVVWARFPSELDARGLPETCRARKEFRWFDRSSDGFRRVESALLVATLGAQVVTTVVLIIRPQSGAAVGAAAAFVGLLALRGVASGLSGVKRAQHGDRALRAAIRTDMAAAQPEMLIHFSGSIRALYQLQQWVPFIISSGHPTVLVVRERPTFDAVEDRWPLPVVFVQQFADLDLVVAPSVKLALYVNTETGNNHLVRFDRLTHVQLHHGDSDKQPSSGKTMRLYDHHIVAGPAAVDRLRSAGATVGPDTVSVVGRPVTDELVQGPLANRRPRVLYAPTWEGYHGDSAVSSVATMAANLVHSLPNDLDLVVRLHPLTGTADRRLLPIVRSLRRSVAARGTAGEFVDSDVDRDLIADMNQADLLICDVSSVLVDFLATNRPMAVCDVLGVGSTEMRRRYPSTSGVTVVAPDQVDIAGIVRRALARDPEREARQASRDRLLSNVGKAELAFHEAIDGLLAQAPRSGPVTDS